jgi:hypothetical protein
VTEQSDLEREAAVFRATNGALVVEVRLSSTTRVEMKSLAAAATAVGADLLWVQADAVDEALDFQRRGGYARLTADQRPDPVELASPPMSLIRDLQMECFSGVWGHAEPAEPDPHATFVALHEAGRWVGICEFDANARWIDGPGVVPELRTPDRYAQLVRGAAARMTSGAVTLETWGDTDATLAGYQRLGFQLAYHVPGWELQLHADNASRLSARSQSAR